MDINRRQTERTPYRCYVDDILFKDNGNGVRDATIQSDEVPRMFVSEMLNGTLSCMQSNHEGVELSRIEDEQQLSSNIREAWCAGMGAPEASIVLSEGIQGIQINAIKELENITTEYGCFNMFRRKRERRLSHLVDKGVKSFETHSVIIKREIKDELIGKEMLTAADLVDIGARPIVFEKNQKVFSKREIIFPCKANELVEFVNVLGI